MANNVEGVDHLSDRNNRMEVKKSPRRFGRRMTFLGELLYQWSEIDASLEHVITCVMYFNKHPDVGRVKQLLRERLLVYDRFCSIAVNDEEEGGDIDINHDQTGQHYHHGHHHHAWEKLEVEAIDMDYHLVEIDLPAGSTKKEVDTFVASTYAARLDPDKPLWRFYLVRVSSGISACVCRIHHSVGDGTTLIEVLLSLMDKKNKTGHAKSLQEKQKKEEEEKEDTKEQSPQKELKSQQRKEEMKRREEEDVTTVINSTTIMKNKSEEISKEKRTIRSYATKRSSPSWISTLRTPPPVFALRVMKWVWGVLMAIMYVFHRKDTPNRLKIGSVKLLSTGRTVSHGMKIPLKLFKESGRLVGGTINDVIVATLTATVRRYLEKHDPDLFQDKSSTPPRITVLFPLNMRFGSDINISDPSQFGNQFTLVPLSLPLEYAAGNTQEELIDLLIACKCYCDEMKLSPMPVRVYVMCVYVCVCVFWNNSKHLLASSTNNRL